MHCVREYLKPGEDSREIKTQEQEYIAEDFPASGLDEQDAVQDLIISDSDEQDISEIGVSSKY